MKMLQVRNIQDDIQPVSMGFTLQKSVSSVIDAAENNFEWRKIKEFVEKTKQSLPTAIRGRDLSAPLVFLLGCWDV
jgi:hypothetical protein